MTLRINCWSGPRNISTALMYSFRQRADTTVVDEPLYGHFLRVTGREHPGRDEVVATMEPDGAVVVRDVILGEVDTPVLFCKQMGHHLVDIDLGFLAACRNVLLTRQPTDMLRSLARVLPDATLADTGLENQVRVLDQILAAGDRPVVVDSARLLADPPTMLARLCAALGLAFDPAMLAWEPGPKPEDGVWASHWYTRVHASSGFEPRPPDDDPLPVDLEPILESALPLYRRLTRYAV